MRPCTPRHGNARARARDLTRAIAAIRESFEELGVLLAWQADGRRPMPPPSPGSTAPGPLPPSAKPGPAAGGRPGLRAGALDHRPRPAAALRRALSGGPHAGRPDPVADEAEQFEPVWVRPAEALARHAAGQFFIIFPTIRTLERLQAYRTVDAVLAACAGEQPLWTSCPRAGLLHGHEARYMEHEPPYGELALVCPDGQIVHELDWQTERPVPLLRTCSA
jgi:hypothetical protein